MMQADRSNLGSGFRRYFRVDAALDETLRDEVYRIRHEVYCEELKFEPERDDRRETDRFDAHSLHCLLSTAHEPLDLVGCARLVCTRHDAPDVPLPFEIACAGTLDRSIVDPARLPRHRIAEVSRLAVRGRYRQRKGEQHSPGLAQSSDFGTAERPRFPYIPVSLYLSAISLALHAGRDILFTLTEPRLANHFLRLGVDIRQIGSPISHRGIRVPSMIDVKSVIRSMRSSMRPLWQAVNEEIHLGCGQAPVLH
ncbi:MAG TPA: PEP-CTERM/exosortase system-associated acyltransferase [Azonexus sp.]